jgi:hypothetical protein
VGGSAQNEAAQQMKDNADCNKVVVNLRSEDPSSQQNCRSNLDTLEKRWW